MSAPDVSDYRLTVGLVFVGLPINSEALEVVEDQTHLKIEAEGRWAVLVRITNSGAPATRPGGWKGASAEVSRSRADANANVTRR
jgi:hypothetical protein